MRCYSGQYVILFLLVVMIQPLALDLVTQRASGSPTRLSFTVLA